MVRIPPNLIWLQWDYEDAGDGDGVTWCVDRINQADVRFIRVGFLLEALKGERQIGRNDLIEILEGLYKGK